MRSKRTTKQVLVKARKLIEKGWCKNVDARNAKGESVSTKSSKAVQWCILGALNCVTTDFDDYYKAEDLLYHCAQMPLSMWNDLPQRIKEEVLRLFDEAIERAE